MTRPGFSPKAHHWSLAIIAALLLHAGLAVTMFRPGESGAAATGHGGIQVGLGPAGGASGAASEVMPEEAPGVAEPLPDATAALPPEVEAPPPETVEEAVAAPPPAAEEPPAEVFPAEVPPAAVQPEIAPAAAPAETPLYAPVEQVEVETPPAPVAEAMTEATPLEEVPAEDVSAEEVPAEEILPEVEMAEAVVPPEETVAQAAMKTPPKPLAKPRPQIESRPPEPEVVERAEPAPQATQSPVTQSPVTQSAVTQTAAVEATAASTANPTKGKPAAEALNGTRGKAGIGSAASSGTARSTSSGGAPGAYVDYKAVLKAWLVKHKEYPRRARLRRQEGEAYLYIAVDGAGRLLDYRIDKSTGYKLLDQEISAMIERAKPLPTAPAGMEAAQFEFRFLVDFGLR